ncbi:MAG: hypothetical protein ABIB41_08305 [Nitrospirota bacterium]
MEGEKENRNISCATYKKGSPYILSIPVHKGKPIKQGLLRDQIAKAGLTVEEFLELYK